MHSTAPPIHTVVHSSKHNNTFTAVLYSERSERIVCWLASMTFRLFVCTHCAAVYPHNVVAVVAAFIVLV
jgi:hypothetical protein